MKEFVDKLIGRLKEQKAINPCRNMKCDECPYTNDCYEGEESVKVAFDNVIEIVKDFAEEHNNGWIPCSERLPEKAGLYIVYSKTGSVYVAHYYKNSIVPHWSKNNGNIIAWQPLPAPYKKGE